MIAHGQAACVYFLTNCVKRTHLKKEGTVVIWSTST